MHHLDSLKKLGTTLYLNQIKSKYLVLVPVIIISRSYYCPTLQCKGLTYLALVLLQETCKENIDEGKKNVIHHFQH